MVLRVTCARCGQERLFNQAHRGDGRDQTASDKDNSFRHTLTPLDAATPCPWSGRRMFLVGVGILTHGAAGAQEVSNISPNLRQVTRCSETCWDRWRSWSPTGLPGSSRARRCSGSSAGRAHCGSAWDRIHGRHGLTLIASGGTRARGEWGCDQAAARRRGPCPIRRHGDLAADDPPTVRQVPAVAPR